ncbi:GNAT family N-acetyltransferase [Marinobacter halodurans]|uniref:GNAT family N-acetyltransferase n=1 Tax=Marinobacter halodurans TaxID=2528979 RepID=A0ABY1ZJI7_9GAMM|nr:GNAT family N-acetyltransferase [Marinobacter halodurans]TBW55169.1 GNAT family N-acetyltransferase [Marinobacter halodurans]
MDIISATPDHGLAIAELALMAGEGIPAHFWDLARRPDQSSLEYGAERAASPGQNFSYRNAHLAVGEGRVMGMLLGYRLPDADAAEDLEDLPDFIRPLVELEQCVPGSYYINMLATYPAFRGQGIGTALMERVPEWAHAKGCDLASVEVFEQSPGAMQLYQRLEYRIVESREVVPHPCYPYTGKVFLLTKRV